MINNLKELNNKVNLFVDYVVKTACEHTTSGNYYVSVDEALKASEMTYEDFLSYKAVIQNELAARDEVLDFDFNEKEEEFDVNCALDYCPGYEWCDGDEEVFGCSYEEWLERPVKPVYQAAAVGSITYHDSGEVVIYSNKEKFLADYASSLDSMGPMGCSAKVASEDDLELRYQVARLQYNEYGEEIAPFEQWKTSIQVLSSDSTAVNKNKPIMWFTVRDGFEEDVAEAQYPSFDAASKVFKDYCNKDGKNTNGASMGVVYKDTERDLRCTLVRNITGSGEPVFVPMYKSLSAEALAVPEVELAALKAQQLRYPFDGLTQARIDLLEKQLGIYDREVNTVGDLYTGKWRVHVVAPGEHYGLNNNLTNDSGSSLVEFWDMSANKGNFPDGQFVSRYYIETLFEDKWGPSPADLMRGGLCLDGGNADVWTVGPNEMKEVFDWLKNRPYKQGEHYLEWHGDVDVPIGKMARWIEESRLADGSEPVSVVGQKLLEEIMFAQPFAGAVLVEPFGSYTNGWGYSVSFVSQANKETVTDSFKKALEGFKYEFFSESKVVDSREEKKSLESVIKTCEQKRDSGDARQGKTADIDRDNR